MKPTNNTSVFLGCLIFATLSWHSQALAQRGSLTLHQTAAKGWLEGPRGVQSFISAGADVNAKDSQGWMPAFAALYNAHVEVVDLLLENGADSTTPYMTAYTGDLNGVKKLLAQDATVDSVKGFTLLHAAAGGGHIDVIKFLISKGFKATASTEEGGRTPLHIAASGAHQEAAQLLLANGAPVDSGEYAPLFYAAWWDHKDMVKFLMSQGADVNRGPMSALHASVDWWWPELGERVLEAGADVNVTDEQGYTPLYHAIVTIEWLEMVEMLVSHGADVNLAPEHEPLNSPLHLAITNGQLEMAKLFVSKGADVHKGSKTKLHLAVKGWSVDLAKLLLEAGVDINTRDEQGATPLHLAVATQQLEMAEYLVSQGADVSIKNNSGTTPLSIAKSKKLIELLSQSPAEAALLNRDFATTNRLLQKGADANTPLLMAYTGNLEGVKRLLSKGTVADGMKGLTLLHAAAAGGHTEVIELLIANGFKATAMTEDDARTPLHYSASANHQEAAQLLIAHGAALNSGYHTPLFDAAEAGHKDMVRFLMRKGVDFNKGPQIPLHLAVRGGHPEIANLLIEVGADINVRDEQGNTPLHSAVATGRLKMVELLDSHGADVNVKNKAGDSIWSIAKTKNILQLMPKGSKRELARLEAIAREQIAQMAARKQEPPSPTTDTNGTPGRVGETRINSLGMKLTYIPAGEFEMGSRLSAMEVADRFDASDKILGFEREHPVHRVRLSRAFMMGVTEVTQGQWESVMGTRPWEGEEYGISIPSLAVSYVNWDDAVEFCKRLSAKEGRTYHLPTEAQWEYACRAGTSTMWNFGDDQQDLSQYAWVRENALEVGETFVHGVGQKRPNGWGLYDMHGNASEWCTGKLDVYPIDADTDSDISSNDNRRNLKGGSWAADTWRSRSANRTWNWGYQRRYINGFRVVLDLD